MTIRKSIHFVLSQDKDADILAWKNSLENGSFNRVVNEILIAESEKKIADIPCGSKKSENLQTINSRLVVYDRYAIELIESFGPKEVTSSIKRIIRKHLNKNRQTVKQSKDDRYKPISEILKAFEVKMTEKAQEYAGVSNKYQKLCNAYDIAIKNLFNELLSCASASTMNDACSNIRKINYMVIINNAFKIAFETPFVKNDLPKSEEDLSEMTAEETERKKRADEFREKMMAMCRRQTSVFNGNNNQSNSEEKKNNSENYGYEDEYEYEDDWDE